MARRVCDITGTTIMSLEKKVGKSLDEKIKKIIQAESVVFSVTIRSNKIVMTGNENVVDIVNKNPEISMREFFNKILNDLEVSTEFASSSPLIFPKFPTQFMGKKWHHELARYQLTNIMNVLGFGRGNSKIYTNPEDKPDGWPPTISFEEVKHPSWIRMDQVNCIIESLLKHHGIDPFKHHQTNEYVKNEINGKKDSLVYEFKQENDDDNDNIQEKEDSYTSQPKDLFKNCFCKIKCPGDECSWKKEPIDDDLMIEDSEDLTTIQDDDLDFSDDSDNDYEDIDDDVDMNMGDNLSYTTNIQEYGEILY